MKKKLLIILTIITGFILTGCASYDTVELQKNALSEGKNDVTGVLYSKSFFQERFMGKEIGYQFLVFGNALQYRLEDYDKRKGERIKSGNFEKLLDDFDVAEYFNGQLNKNIGGVKTFKIVMEKDPEKSGQIIEYFAADNDGAKPSQQKFKPGTTLLALKLSYGLAVRPGNEQIGLRKYYRPYIRILGRAKIADSNKIIWQNGLLAYGEKRYLGDEADASRIKKEELVQAFKQITDEVIGMLIKNLNGEKLGEMPGLQGLNKADNSF